MWLHQQGIQCVGVQSFRYLYLQVRHRLSKLLSLWAGGVVRETRAGGMRRVYISSLDSCVVKLCQGSTGALGTPHLQLVTYAQLHNLRFQERHCL